MVPEQDLATLAKQFRSEAGISKAQAGRELGVTRGTIQQAEEYPHVSLTKLRVKMIERYSPFSIAGPIFILKRKQRAIGSK